MLELSVIVPAYREGATIRVALKKLTAVLESTNFDYEVIVVSDGNIDATAANARKAKGPIQVIEYAVNRGKGYAVRAGVAAATGKVVAFIDADMEIDPADLPQLVGFVQRGADAAIGSKWHPQSEVSYPLRRRLQSRVFWEFTRALFHLGVRDTQTGLKVFWGESLRTIMPLLKVDRFAFDLEWLAILKAAGGTIVESPVRVVYTDETTTSLHAAFSALWDAITVFRRRRWLQKKGRIPHLVSR